MKSLEDLQRLHSLRRISQGNFSEIDTNALETEFLSFSAQIPAGLLTLRMPRLYALESSERQHYHDALMSIGVPDGEQQIDIGGGTIRIPADVIALLSLRQLEADYAFSDRVFLNPLLERIYAEGGTMIRDFSIHEAIVGRTRCSRGDLDLKDIPLYPERFTSGPYTLSVDLDTPGKTLHQIRLLHEELESIVADPMLMLDASRVMRTTDMAVSLRSTIGAIARYDLPKSSHFSVDVDTCVVQYPFSQVYFLRADGKNIAVHFGGDPIRNPPASLRVLDGEDWRGTLSAMVDHGLYEPSVTVLDSRIADMRSFYDGAGRSLVEGAPETKRLLLQLESAREALVGMQNPDMRRQFALSQPHEALECMLYPASSDPILYGLLPRLSWNPALREYHDTLGFMAKFSGADDVQRTSMLRGILLSARYLTQQNNDVNAWLYSSQQDICRDAGVSFDVQR